METWGRCFNDQGFWVPGQDREYVRGVLKVGPGKGDTDVLIDMTEALSVRPLRQKPAPGLQSIRAIVSETCGTHPSLTSTEPNAPYHKH